MRKGIHLLLIVSFLFALLTACTSATVKDVESTETSEAAEEAFNPSKAKDAMNLQQLRELNGIEVPVEKNLQIVAVMKSLNNEYWSTMQKGYEKISSLSGAKMYLIGTQTELEEEEQRKRTSAFEGSDIDAFMLSPITDQNLADVVEKARKNDIITVNVDDGLLEKADYYVGPNTYENGQLAAQWISEKLEDRGQVAIIKGIEEAYSTRERTEGFKDWIKDNESQLDIVEEVNADWDRNLAKGYAASWIRTYPGLKAIFCNNDDMALGAVEAVKEAGVDILVVGVDGIGEAYDSIRAGELSATIDAFPYYVAQIATECTLRAIAGQELPSVLITPQALIDAENVDKDPTEILDWKEPIFIKE